MSRWSIRARLTAWIAIMTALIAFLSAWAAIEFLADEAKANALDERQRSIELVNELRTSDSGLSSGAQADRAADTLGDLPVSDALFDRFADRSGVLLVDVGDGGGLLAAFASVDGPTSLVHAPPEAVRLSWADLAVLMGQAEPLGAPRVVEGAQLAFDERTIDGARYGVVADVTIELNDLIDLNITLWVAAGVLSGLAGWAAWLTTGRALRPVERIISEVDQIHAGNPIHRVGVPDRQDEIHRLATTMNLMLDRLDADRRRRRQFAADASHELRTPVAVLRSEAEAELIAPDNDAPDRLATVVLAETGRMAGVVDDLLTLARADESLAQPASRIPNVDLDELVLAERTRRRRVRVDFSAVSAGRVLADPDEIARVIGHLLDNAVRHAQSNVTIGVRTIDEIVELWVDDDGPGIPKSERQRVFERFVRLDDARHRDHGGAGLGLAVCYAAVTAANGTIAVQTSPEQGARFMVTFPAAP